jgi:hypothetical protein
MGLRVREVRGEGARMGADGRRPHRAGGAGRQPRHAFCLASSEQKWGGVLLPLRARGGWGWGRGFAKRSNGRGSTPSPQSRLAQGKARSVPPHGASGPLFTSLSGRLLLKRESPRLWPLSLATRARRRVGPLPPPSSPLPFSSAPFPSTFGCRAQACVISVALAHWGTVPFPPTHSLPPLPPAPPPHRPSPLPPPPRRRRHPLARWIQLCLQRRSRLACAPASRALPSLPPHARE